MSSTAMHSMLVALVSMAQTALGPNFAVYDGPLLTNSPDTDFLVLGVDSLENNTGFDTATQGESNWITFSTQRTRDEKFQVFGVMVAWDGGGTFASVRARAIGNLDIFSAALRADPSVNGSTTIAATGLSVTGIKQVASTIGQVVHVSFAISCRARI